MTAANSYTLLMHLADAADHSGKEDIRIGITPDSLSIASERHGVCGEQDDSPLQEFGRTIVVIERWAGELRCIVWADINKEDPTHIISLEKAALTNRKDS